MRWFRIWAICVGRFFDFGAIWTAALRGFNRLGFSILACIFWMFWMRVFVSAGGRVVAGAPMYWGASLAWLRERVWSCCVGYLKLSAGAVSWSTMMLNVWALWCLARACVARYFARMPGCHRAGWCPVAMMGWLGL